MKAVKCELCGSNELIKDGGVFVCQHCGTKYTLEEARKLMIDGPVTVEGIAGAGNLILRAKDFEGKGDIDSAIDYFNRVLDLDINNEEAKAGIERLNKVITEPNLTVVFQPARSGMTSENVFVNGEIVFNICAGETKSWTVPYGENEIGVGTFRCKHPEAVKVTRQTKYRMTIVAKTFSTEFQVVRL